MSTFEVDKRWTRSLPVFSGFGDVVAHRQTPPLGIISVDTPLSGNPSTPHLKVEGGGLIMVYR